MNESFDEDGLDVDDEEFGDFDQGGQTLGDLWRNNPLIKVGAIVLAGAAVIFVLYAFSGQEDPLGQSYVGSASDVSAPPGTEEVSPAYREAVTERNEAEIERAEREGTSALPTPIDPPVGTVPLLEEEEQQEDPLARWRQLQEERLRRELERQQDVQPVEPVEQVDLERIQNMSARMAEQMQAILESTGEAQVQHMTMTSPQWLEDLRAAEEEARAEQEAAEAAAAAEAEEEDTVIFPAGQIAYAQLLTEANTDVPGPVLAQIVAGPLKGARLLGDFQEQNELITLNFNTLVLDDESIGVDAIALDPDTTLPGIATDVDRRILQRVMLPMAAAFVEGAAEAIAESGRTTVTIQGETVSEQTQEADTEEEIASGIEEAGQELRSILDEMADDIEVLVRIEAGTPLGILFLEPVTDSQ